MSSNGSKQVKWYLSWPFIIVMIIVFWPIGLGLLFARLSKDRRASIVIGRLLKIIGGFVIAVSALLLLSLGYQEDPAFVVGFSIFLIILAVLLWWYGSRLVKQSKLYKEYINLVVNQRISSIHQIASIMNRDAHMVRDDLKKMIDKNFFPNAYIDLQNFLIVVPVVQKQAEFQQQVPENQGAAEMYRPVQPRVVTCKSCGANNMIAPGSPSECEFCGSAL